MTKITANSINQTHINNNIHNIELIDGSVLLGEVVGVTDGLIIMEVDVFLTDLENSKRALLN